MWQKIKNWFMESRLVKACISGINWLSNYVRRWPRLSGTLGMTAVVSAAVVTGSAVVGAIGFGIFAISTVVLSGNTVVDGISKLSELAMWASGGFYTVVVLAIAFMPALIQVSLLSAVAMVVHVGLMLAAFNWSRMNRFNREVDAVMELDLPGVGELREAAAGVPHAAAHATA